MLIDLPPRRVKPVATIRKGELRGTDDEHPEPALAQHESTLH